MAVRAIANAVVQGGIDFIGRRKKSAGGETEGTEAHPEVARGCDDIEQSSTGADSW